MSTILSVFGGFMVSHLVGDYLLQNGWQALNKARGRFLNAPLLVHCLLYSLAFLPCFLYWDIDLAWLTVIFGTHMFIDRRWPVVMFLKLKDGKLNDPSFDPPFWLVIINDQIFHILTFTAIILITEVW